MSTLKAHLAQIPRAQVTSSQASCLVTCSSQIKCWRPKMEEKLHLPPEGPTTSSLVSYIERFTTFEHILPVCVLGRLEHTCSVLVHVPGTRLVVLHRRLRGLEGMRVDIVEPQEIVFFFPVAHCVFELAYHYKDDLCLSPTDFDEKMATALHRHHGREGAAHQVGCRQQESDRGEALFPNP